VYVALPMGPFNYTWSPIIQDAASISLGYHRLHYLLFRGNVLKDAIQDAAHAKEPSIIEFVNKYHGSYVKAAQMMRCLGFGPNPNVELLDKYLKILENYSEYKSFAEVFKYQGDNGSLVQAIQSGHEIMIKCEKALLIKEEMYNQILEKYL